MSYDPKVYQLVEDFLTGTPEKTDDDDDPGCCSASAARVDLEAKRNRRLLAQHIQDELEDWTLFMLLPDVQVADEL